MLAKISQNGVRQHGTDVDALGYGTPNVLTGNLHEWRIFHINDLSRKVFHFYWVFKSWIDKNLMTFFDVFVRFPKVEKRVGLIKQKE